MAIKVIGITGPTGAGKSLFSEYLAGRGIATIDADEVYHGLLVPPSPCLDALRRAFGDGIFREDKSLDRKALSSIVFHDPDKLSLLNETVLRFVLDKIRSRIGRLEKEGASVVAVDAPTLIESGFHRECDRVVSVLCPSGRRLERIVARDALSREAAEARILAQKNDYFYREHSDFILTNNGSREEFFAKCEELLPSLLSSPPS